jgi:alkylation response protein AidB-like acyl-CoA dehydrogenase
MINASEPGHGSDLASIETSAEEKSDHYVINGQKVWSTNGHFADWNALIARTNSRANLKYKGLTFFIVNMQTPGITVNPIINMAGHHDFNEVFFEDVVIPKENIIGGVNQGWYMVMALLDFERTADLSYAIAETLLNDITESARDYDLFDTLTEHRMAELMAECEVARLMHYYVTWMQSQGKSVNHEAAMCKLLGFEAVQHVAEFGMCLFKEYALLSEKSPLAPMYGRVSSCYLRSFGHSLEQGTSEIDRDVIAQLGLGLPRLR